MNAINNSDDCSICCTSVDHENKDTTVLAHTGALHYFHRDCLVRWIHFSKGEVCPNCRDPITDTKVLALAQEKLQEHRLNNLIDPEASARTISSLLTHSVSLLPPVSSSGMSRNVNRSQRMSFEEGFKTSRLTRLIQLIAINVGTYKLIEDGTCGNISKYLRGYDLLAGSFYLLAPFLLITPLYLATRNTSDFPLFKKIAVYTIAHAFLSAPTYYISYRVMNDDCGEETKNMALIFTTICVAYTAFLACRKSLFPGVLHSPFSRYTEIG